MVVSTLVLSFLAAISANGQQPPSSPPCSDDAAFAQLDFWVGEWTVKVAGKPVGTNRIEKILEGCAIMEHWRADDGGEGKSLFYYIPASKEWKQVWVTQRPSTPGGVKEKRLAERTADGGLVFLGEVPLAGGGTYLDRTILTPRHGGAVGQRIEISTDGGKTWKLVFDAVYERR